jgi:hypothetical protein
MSCSDVLGSAVSSDAIDSVAGRGRAVARNQVDDGVDALEPEPVELLDADGVDVAAGVLVLFDPVSLAAVLDELSLDVPLPDDSPEVDEVLDDLLEPLRLSVL